MVFSGYSGKAFREVIITYWLVVSITTKKAFYLNESESETESA